MTLPAPVYGALRRHRHPWRHLPDPGWALDSLTLYRWPIQRRLRAEAVVLDGLGRRGLLLGGMAAYLVLALTIPHAFGQRGAGLALGLAYLVIVLIHSGLFTRASGRGARGILRIAPFNVASALLILAGGALGGGFQYALWALAFVVEWSTPLLVPPQAFFEIQPAHFVERHGLVVIIAIGESVVAIGIGASVLVFNAAIAGAAVLGLALTACLWWAYFGQDDARAESALANETARPGSGSVPRRRRALPSQPRLRRRGVATRRGNPGPLDTAGRNPDRAGRADRRAHDPDRGSIGRGGSRHGGCPVNPRCRCPFCLTLARVYRYDRARRPGQRAGFAHRHRTAEEIYVVLPGSGAVSSMTGSWSSRRSMRPGQPRRRASLPSRPEGLEVLEVLEVLGFGLHVEANCEMVHDFWREQKIEARVAEPPGADPLAGRQ